jgi:putative hydrolase of the HAD superfamily
MKAIIFDFFGVINSDTGMVWLRKNIPDEQASENLRAMFSKVDIGETPELEFFQIAAHKVGRSPSDVRNEWFELSHINPDVISLIAELRKEYKIALCTNAPSALVRDILQKTGIDNYFDDIFISSELKMIKPHPDIFMHILNKLGLKPEKALFIDDSITNVNGARNIGMQALQFTDATQLKADISTILNQ